MVSAEVNIYGNEIQLTKAQPHLTISNQNFLLTTGVTSTGAALCISGWGMDFFLDKNYPGQNISGISHERVVSEF